MLSLARRRAWRMAAVCALPPAPGGFVGRAISPAAWGLRHRRAFRDDASTAARRRRFRAQSTKCRPLARRSSPADAGQAPAGLFRISPPQGGNAPLRLRLAAHPPPLAGEALGGLSPGRLPCKGSCRHQPTEGCGTLPCEYTSGQTQAPRRAISPAAWGLRYCRGCGTMRASSPTDAGQGPAGLCRVFPPPGGNAPLRLRLAAHPPSGLRCPHRAACAEAHLRSATAAPAPSRCIRRRRRSTPQPLAGEALGAALTRSQIPVSPVCKLCYNRGQTPKQGNAGRARAGVRTWGRPAHGRAAQKIAPKFSNKENLP